MSASLSKGQMEYERKRAQKAGMSLEKWLDAKQRRERDERLAAERATRPAAPARKPGLFGRMIERASRPLGAKEPAAGKKK